MLFVTSTKFHYFSAINKLKKRNIQLSLGSIMIDKIEKWTNKTNFNSYDDFETNPCAKIICPNCNDRLNIKMKDLKKHQDSHFSNLKKEDNSSLTRIITVSAPTFTNSSLDYYCPNCKSATRILYDFWAGGRHGEYGFDLKYIANIK